ncbi:PTS lactose/cellobiose transporter subunit IIA [Halobacillus sp. A1]|uniref:PTS lactose/cellobiose transporter subunit IIA n=1 Tax=Halobacillus sp. A1 TaxID=2880262 RepID=UPI0020A68C09|nr:PTS lactose/cellobiose transporter subunit IIA [Halobacillus sp. A1]MCP3030242.1 PTS lactose/cellobiose transporter subunit IIA [Halobacillus sp. A1]
MDVDITAFMPLITESAQSKNNAFEALTCAKDGDREGYHEKMSLSKEFLLNAHKEQTNILSLNARTEEIPITVYLIHAMDHVSNAQMVHDLVKEVANLYLNK